MLEFKRYQNSRHDFGLLFDHYIEKSWSRGYLRSEDAVERCLAITREFAKSENRAITWDADLKDLFYDSSFINSTYFEDLISLLVDESIVIPTYHIEWFQDDSKVGDNFIWTEIYETDKLPHYYILNCNEPVWPVLLVNRNTGTQLNLLISEILPSENLHMLNGKFLENGLHSDVYYQLEFDINTSKNEIIGNSYKAVHLESIIKIPAEIADSTNVLFISSINPNQTNIEHHEVKLTDQNDIEFREMIMAKISNRYNRSSSDLDLPF